MLIDRAPDRATESSPAACASSGGMETTVAGIKAGRVGFPRLRSRTLGVEGQDLQVSSPVSGMPMPPTRTS